MKKMIVLSALLAFLQYAVNAQRVKIEGEYGIVLGTARTYKKFMFLTGGNVTMEWELNYKNSFKSGVGMNTLSYTSGNDSGAAVFARRRMIYVPISIRRKYQVTRTTIIDFEWGIRNSLYYRESREIFNPVGSTKEAGNNMLYNLGGMISFGLNTPVSAQTDFRVGMGGYMDFLDVSGKEAYRFKAKAYQVSLGFSRKL